MYYVRKLLPLSAQKWFHFPHRQHKICELRKAIFCVFYNILRPNFGILLLLKGSFWEYRFFVWIYLDQKLVYNANDPLHTNK